MKKQWYDKLKMFDTRLGSSTITKCYSFLFLAKSILKYKKLVKETIYYFRPKSFKIATKASAFVEILF